MGDSTPFPSPSAIKRAERLTRERFVLEGETREAALAPGSARRRALDAALLEVDAGLAFPSQEWRQEYSLLLGLERVLSDDEPKLVDGTVLSAHQVDALSGTLTALLAGVQAPESLAPAGAQEPEAQLDEPATAPAEVSDEPDEQPPALESEQLELEIEALEQDDEDEYDEDSAPDEDDDEDEDDEDDDDAGGS